MRENKLFKEFCTDRNLSKNSIETYHTALKDYTVFNNLSLEELIDEADKEEEERIRSSKRKILKRLKKYRNHKIKQNSPPNTIKTRFGQIKTFYRHFGIEIPYIPPVQIKNKHHETFEDIPTIKHIKEVVESTSNLKHKALILFMSSSGTAINETLNLRIKDFITATSEYHNEKNIYDVLKKLKTEKDIIPLFKLIRLKTDHHYYTCCSPEATNAIIKYLANDERKLTPNDKIFDLKMMGAMSIFQRITENQGWEKVGSQWFFHSHALRKFHATAIEDGGLVNTLQGRKADSVTEAYFKHNPKRIKEKYLEHLSNLTINKTEVNILNDEGTKKLKKVEDENIRINKELEELKELVRTKLDL